LRRELAAPNYRPDTIAVGVNTDAYQPIERALKITRSVIEVLHETRHPFALLTKSSLIERDIDLLADLARQRLVRVAVTLTTLDHDVSRKLEPRAASPTRRLRIIRTLTDAGIPLSVSVAPIIPFITDSEIEHILEQAAEAGALRAHFIVLRLPWELNDVFQQWLQTHFPLRAERVMNRIRDLHGGKDYDSRFGTRQAGQGIWAELFRQRFDKACSRLGLNRHDPGQASRFEIGLFRKPLVVAPRISQNASQLDLFT
jgi:DNA repair photolyase